ncbi:MAG: hypothetical protein ACRDH8_06805 [Actinomycetota bacterium]
MRNSTTLAKARAAKRKVAKMVEGDPSVTGIGIARIGRGYGVKLNVTEQLGNAVMLPQEVDGVPLRVETVGRISKRTPA